MLHVYQEDPVIRRLSDAQYDTLAERRDFDVRKINGWRSLPIDESTFFARCAVCARSVRGLCAVVCGRVRCCAVLCGAEKFALTNWSDEQTHEICRQLPAREGFTTRRASEGDRPVSRDYRLLSHTGTSPRVKEGSDVCFEPPHGSRRRLKAVKGGSQRDPPTRTISGKTTISKD
jgi:hypothetical protein